MYSSILSAMVLCTRRRLVRSRYVFGSLLLVGGPVVLADKVANEQALTIENATVSAQIEVLDPLQAEQERLQQLIKDKPKAYQDKVMNSDTLLELTVDDATQAEQPAGFRAYTLESRLDFAETDSTDFDTRRSGEAGVRFEYRFDTQNYGEFVGQLDARSLTQGDSHLGLGSLGKAEQPDNVRVTVRNLGLPVTRRILADTALGDISSEVTSAFGRSYRLSLGTATVRGIGTRIYADNFDLRAGSGQRGERVGGPYPGFEVLEGEVSWLGASYKVSDKVFVGVQLNQASGLASGSSVPDTADTVHDVTSVAATVGYGRELLAEGDKKWRVSAVWSQLADSFGAPSKEASGIFVEGGFQSGRNRHELGMYTTSPGLQFGDNTLMANSRGAYWRVDHKGTRLDMGGGLDLDQYNPGQRGDGFTTKRISLSSNAQYRMDRNRSLGGSFNLSESQSERGSTGGDTSSHTRSARGSVYYQLFNRDWGRSRLSATVHRNETLVKDGVAATGDEIQWEQDWITGKYATMRPELTTTVGLAHDRSESDSHTYPTAGINTRYWFDSDWSASAQLRYTSRSGNLFTSRGLSGTMATELALGKDWQLGAAVNFNQAKVEVVGNGSFDPQISRTNDKSAYLYLRWAGNAGRPYELMGVRNAGQTGSGSITGQVFFDVNRDGERQLDETKVPGVEVYLDGRYRALTDREGHFEFSQVTTGHHLLSLNPDTVPLPWGLSDQREVRVDVPLRGQATAYLPVVKVAE